MSASSAFHDTFGRDAFGDYGRPGSGSRPQPAPPAAGPGRARTGKAGAAEAHPAGAFCLIGVPLILLAALVLSFSGFLNAPAKAADSAAELSLTPTVTVTVQSGESLWAIAEAVAPERDPRDVVADIIQLNNLEAARSCRARHSSSRPTSSFVQPVRSVRASARSAAVQAPRRPPAAPSSVTVSGAAAISLKLDK